MLEIKELASRISGNQAIGKLEKEGYFLASCFATLPNDDQMPKEWILHYFNPDTKKTVDYFVNENSVGDEMPAMDESEPLAMEKAALSVGDALSIAKKEFSSAATTVLITLHSKAGRVIWTINMISPALMATSYDIDARNGDILQRKVTSLFRRA